MLDVTEERAAHHGSSSLLLQEHINRYLFAAQFVQGQSVLDAACGAGYSAPIFWVAGATSYLGVDLSEAAIAHAKSAYVVADLIRFYSGDASTLDDVADASIDVAISFETIEHVPDPEQMLNSLDRVLRPGGLLIISTPNRSYCRPADTLESTPPNPFHIREWSHEEFAELLSRHFRIRATYGQFLTTKTRVAVRRAIIKSGMLPLYRKLRKRNDVQPPLEVLAPGGLSEWASVEPMTQKQTANYLIFVANKK